MQQNLICKSFQVPLFLVPSELRIGINLCPIADPKQEWPLNNITMIVGQL